MEVELNEMLDGEESFIYLETTVSMNGGVKLYVIKC